MLKGIQWFVDRLVARLIPIVATSFSSTLETFHALGQAEQQSQLEEAARRYDAEGKTEIATILRRRAAQLTSGNPAAQALEIYENVAGDPQRLLPPTQESTATDLAQLPDFAGKPTRSRTKRPPSEQPGPSDA